MTSRQPTITALRELIDLVHEVQGWACEHLRAEPTDQWVRRLAELEQEFTASARNCTEAAAWCRLMAGLLRGEDVPLWIYPQDGEDPADTARWERWRVS
jgi:hypothetical protein